MPSKQKTNNKSILKNYLYNMVYQVLILVLPLVTTPYLARVLGAENIGIYGYTFANVTYFILFGSLGVALYGQREIAYNQNNPENRKKTFIEIILFRFVSITIAFFVYSFVFVYNGGTYKQYYAILIIELIAAGFDISWFFQGMEDFKRTVVRNVLVRICSVTLVFLLVKTKEDLAKFMLIYSIADLVGNLSLWLYLPKYFRGIKIKNIEIARHIYPILLLFIPQIANQVYKILDTTMIGKMIPDKSETGYYEQAQKVIRLLLTIVTSLGVVMIPRMANTFINNDKKKIREYLQMSFRFVFFISFPIMFGIICVAPFFVPVFFGTGYDKVIVLIRIISPILILMGIGNVLGTQYLIPTKRQKEYTISVVCGIVFNFIANYILIRKYASVGASIATVFSELVVIIVQYICVREDISLKELFKISWKYILAATIMFLICLNIGYINTQNSVETALIGLASKTNFKSRLFINLFNTGVIALVGVNVYFTALVVLKDEFVFKFIDKLKAKIGFKNKKEEEVK